MKLDDAAAARVATAWEPERMARMRRDSKAGRTGLVVLARRRGDTAPRVKEHDPLGWSQEEPSGQEGAR